MSGYAICPYCRATVQPLVGADGQNLCPRCHNRGPAGPAAGAVVPAAVQPTVPGATASLVLGIVGIVLEPLGIILGIIAIVMANNAQKALDAAPGAYAGAGVVTAGRVLGIVGIALGVVSLIGSILVFGVVGVLNG